MMLRRTISPLWFVFPVLAVYAAALSIVHALPHVHTPGIVAAAMTVDVVLLVPGLYYLVLVRGRGWPPITVAPVFLLSFGSASLIIPDDHHIVLNAVGLVLPIIELMVVGYVGCRAVHIFRRSRSQPESDFYDRMRFLISEALSAPVAAGALAYEISLFHYAFSIRPAPGPDAGITYHRKSGYGAILAAIVLVAVGELIGLHFLLLMWSETAALVHLGLSAYGLIWLVGDYRAMRRRPHIVHAGGIKVRCGLRWNVTLSWKEVEVVHRARRPESMDEYVSTVPIGSPTYIVELSGRADAIGLYGITKPVRRVGLIVDDPDAFEARLREYGVRVV